MRLRDVIREKNKTKVTFGPWSTEKPKRKDFPLSCKSGWCYPLTRQWRWTTVHFDIGKTSYTILIAYHLVVPEFSAILAERVSNDSRVIGRLEYHANHAEVGWHLHANCDEAHIIGVGMVKPLGQLRIPAARSKHSKGKYTLNGDSMNDNMALAIAGDRYRFPYQTSLIV